MTVPTPFPGVPVTESSFQSRSITGVPTSITAFVGSAVRGPVGTPTTIRDQSEFVRTFGPPSETHPLGHLVRDFFGNGGQEAVVVRLSRTGSGVLATASTASLGPLELEARYVGAWGDRLSASVAAGRGGAAAAAAQGVAVDELVDLTVVDSATGETEVFADVTAVDGPRRIDLVLADSQLVRVRAVPTTRPAPTPATSFTGGADGDPLSEEDYAGDEAARTGVWSLLDVDLVNLVCLAPPSLATDVTPVAWQAASRFSVARRAFLVVDTPVAATSTHDVATFASTTLGITGDDARGVGLYFPRLRASDASRGGAISEIPCSGAVAGVIARTDTERGVGKSPSGTTAAVSGALGLAVPVGADILGVLHPLGINCLRTTNGGSTLVWGARTLRGADAAGPDDYRYVPVRRLALFLEESLVRGLAWVAFEPNDGPLWAAIRLSVDAFLEGLFRDGAFAGRTVRDSYFVHCDATTTMPADVEAGVVHVDIGVAPLRPAEFVVIRIGLRTASA
jgi:phage tail sheath protein FI